MILVSSNQSDIEISERPSAIDFVFKKNNLPISKTKAMLLDCPYQYCTENIGGNCSDCSVGLVPIKLSNVACPA